MKRVIASIARRMGIALARYPSEGTFAGELYRLLRGVQPDVFLDIGAHQGESSQLARALGFKGRIVAIEPDESCLFELRRRAADDPDWEVLPVALGLAKGSATLLRMDCSGLSSLRAPLARPGDATLRSMRVTNRLTVEVRTLEDVLASDLESGQVIAKIDAQGCDLEIMESAGEQRRRIVAAILEAPLVQLYQGMHSLPATLDRMREWGYDVTGVVPVSRDGLERVLEVDLFFMRTSRRTSDEDRVV